MSAVSAQGKKPIPPMAPGIIMLISILCHSFRMSTKASLTMPKMIIYGSDILDLCLILSRQIDAYRIKSGAIFYAPIDQTIA